MNRTIIPGPPGTGKTYRLVNHHLSNELHAFKTNSKKIAYITFSNAATDEAKKRIYELYPQFEFDHICTMHSMGTKALDIDTNTQLLKDKNWNGFKNYSQICKDLHFDKVVRENGFVEYKNNYMKVIEYSRSKRLELVDAAIELDVIDYIDIPLLEQIHQDLNDYKEQFNMYEFSDMIIKFVEKKLCPSLDVVFLDEAQDLSPLQWEMFFYIESQCKRSYIAGDDDQAIYSFQGANPNIFINLQGKMDPQINSRRVPKIIHKVALSILENIDDRMTKTWNPREALGDYRDDLSLDDIDFSKGEWMILTRTNNQQLPIIEHLNNLNVRFDCKNNELLPPKLIEAINVWNRLNQGANVSGSEAQLVYEYLSYKDKQLKYGFSNGKSLDNVNSLDIDDLMSEHGLLVTGSWEQLKISDEQKLFIKELLDKGEDLNKPARIKVSTIHSVKGEEAENVILFTDLEPIIYQSALINKDTEHRLFFVGVTRAKEKLFVMDQGYDYQYQIGGEIT